MIFLLCQMVMNLNTHVQIHYRYDAASGHDAGSLVPVSDRAAAVEAEKAAAERAADVKSLVKALRSICCATRGPGSMRQIAGLVGKCTDLVQFSMHADAVRSLLVRRELDTVVATLHALRTAAVRVANDTLDDRASAHVLQFNTLLEE